MLSTWNKVSIIIIIITNIIITKACSMLKTLPTFCFFIYYDNSISSKIKGKEDIDL